MQDVFLCFLQKKLKTPRSITLINPNKTTGTNLATANYRMG